MNTTAKIDEGILKRKLKLYKVSPLYNFNLENLALYKKSLREELGNSCSINFSSNVEFDGQVFHALQVEVKSSKKKKMRLYRGTLINVATENSSLQGCVSLPILLVEGRQNKASAVHSFLCKIFDCDIHRASIPFKGLITLFVKILEQPDGNVNIPEEIVSLEYQFPGGDKENKVRANFALQDTILILAGTIDFMRESCPGIDNTKIIEGFYRKILTHMHSVYSIDFGMLELNEIIFPNAVFTQSGEVKLSTERAIKIGLSLFELVSV